MIVVVALLATWTVWQPLRADALAQKSLQTLEDGDADAARAQAIAAHDRNPLALDPLLKLAQIEQADNRQIQARAALQQAVSLQPANPESWLALAQFELKADNPQAGLTASRRAVYLDPRSSRPIGVFLEARRQIAARTPTK